MDIFLISVIVIIVLLGIYCWIQDHKHNKKLRDKYNVSKFPVISKMENKYFVEILYKEDRWRGNYFECNVYQRIFKTDRKYKDKLLISGSVDFESFGYNYIKVATRCVNDYEKEHMEELSKIKFRDESVAKNKELFDQWNGVIMEEKEN